MKQFSSFLVLSSIALAVACNTVRFEDDGAGGDAADGNDGYSSGTGTKQGSTRAAVNAAATGTSRGSAINAIGAGDFGPNGPNLASLLMGVQLSANCQPEIADNPISGSITLRYDTIYTPTEATITVGRIYAVGGDGNIGDKYLVSFTPASTGEVVPGQPVTVTHQVTGAMGDASGICNHCGEYLGMDLTYDNSGQVSMGVSLSCAF